VPYLLLLHEPEKEGGSDNVDYADLIGPIAAPDKEILREVGITRRSA
jgi:hypothetical protein